MHLQRKTAWSNKSLIGCRISCLVDFKEWHEGHVSQFHRSGKHYVEFRAIGEKRWLNMKKIVFYIIERPLSLVSCSGECNDDEIFENSGLAPVEVEFAILSYLWQVVLNFSRTIYSILQPLHLSVSLPVSLCACLSLSVCLSISVSLFLTPFLLLSLS